MGRPRKRKADHIEQVLADGVRHGLQPYDYGKAMARIRDTGIRVDRYFGWPTIEEPKTLDEKADYVANASLEEEVRRAEREAEKRKRALTDHPCANCGTIIKAGRQAKYCCKSCYNKSPARLEARKRKRLEGII